MQAHEMTFRTFFAGAVQFVAPSFQRPYAWERDSWEPILISALQPGKGEHFLGAMVTMSIGANVHGMQKQLLVDGQHRLLTVLTLLAALRAAALPHDEPFARMIQTQCLTHNADDAQPHHKLITVRRDRAAFERLLATPPDGEGGHPLSQAFRFFHAALADAAIEELRTAYHRIAYHFVVVGILLDKDEDPYPIYKSLSIPEQPFTKTGLEAYTRFSPDPALMALIAGGESQEVEFKEASLVRPAGDREEPRGGLQVARSVAGFMNSADGGVLLLGVRDDGSIRGINDEYAAVDRGKANWDGYQLFLHNVLRMRLSIETPFLFYSVERRSLQGRDLVLIRVRPAPAPVYLDKHLFVRSGNQTIEMQGPDLVHYVALRWPEQLPKPDERHRPRAVTDDGGAEQDRAQGADDDSGSGGAVSSGKMQRTRRSP